MPFESIQPTRIYQQIATAVAGMIRSGELAQGERLPGEHELARRLEVSRGAVREAMIALEAGGLVEVRNGSGSFVRPDAGARLDVDWGRGFEAEPGPVEQLEMRELLEPEAAARAASRIEAAQLAELRGLVERMEASHRERNSFAEGRAFVATIAAAAGNSILAAMIDELWRLRGGTLWGTIRERVLDAEHRRAAIDRRLQVIKALEARDPTAARRAMRGYLALTRELFFDGLGGKG